jgi:hypothetical protein
MLRSKGEVADSVSMHVRLSDCEVDAATLSGFLSVDLTRTELVTLRETIELTPVFNGRSEARTAIQELLRSRARLPLRIEESVLAALARRIVPIDVPSAALRSKLNRVLSAAAASTDVALAQPA